MAAVVRMPRQIFETLQVIRTTSYQFERQAASFGSC
jgi:hypothetical protein